MALFISKNSYAPGGISISKQSDIDPISSRTMILVLTIIFRLIWSIIFFKSSKYILKRMISSKLKIFISFF